MATAVPDEQQQQRARWDLLLLDIEQRTEQVRQLKTYEGPRLIVQAITAAAAVFAAGGVVGGLIVNLWIGGIK
jgi:hypothetical protein